MTLSELLTELRTNILYDRSDRVAGTPDYLWSDATLIRYINEAQNRFARLGLVIRDGQTPDATEVMIRTGVTEYALHPSVLAVISAKMPGDTADLARAGHSAFQTYRQPDPYFFDPAQLSTMPPGKPLAYGTDEYLGSDDYGIHLQRADFAATRRASASGADVADMRIGSTRDSGRTPARDAGLGSVSCAAHRRRRCWVSGPRQRVSGIV